MPTGFAPVIDQFVDVTWTRQQIHHVHLMRENHEGHYVTRWREGKLRAERIIECGFRL